MKTIHHPEKVFTVSVCSRFMNTEIYSKQDRNRYISRAYPRKPWKTQGKEGLPR